jgi:hypothetical protein
LEVNNVFAVQGGQDHAFLGQTYRQGSKECGPIERAATEHLDNILVGLNFFRQGFFNLKDVGKDPLPRIFPSSSWKYQSRQPLMYVVA